MKGMKPPCRMRAFASAARPPSGKSLLREFLALGRRNYGFNDRVNCTMGVEMIRSRTQDPAFTISDVEEGAAQVVQHTSELLQARRYQDVSELCVRGPGRDARGIANDLAKFGFFPDDSTSTLTCDVDGPGHLEGLYFLIGEGCEHKEVRPYGFKEAMEHYDNQWNVSLETSLERVGGNLMSGFLDLGRRLMSEQISLLAVVNVEACTSLTVSKSHREIGREFMRKDVAAFFERRAAENRENVEGGGRGAAESACSVMNAYLDTIDAMPYDRLMDWIKNNFEKIDDDAIDWKIKLVGDNTREKRMETYLHYPELHADFLFLRFASEHGLLKPTTNGAESPFDTENIDIDTFAFKFPYGIGDSDPMFQILHHRRRHWFIRVFNAFRWQHKHRLKTFDASRDEEWRHAGDEYFPLPTHGYKVTAGKAGKETTNSRAARVLLEGTIRNRDLTWKILNFDLGVCRFNSFGPGLDELSALLRMSDYTYPNTLTSNMSLSRLLISRRSKKTSSNRG